MTKTRILLVAYWLATTLTAGLYALDGTYEVLRDPTTLLVMKARGYPPYFAVILGGWKLLAAILIVVPGLVRLKEWVYAGMVLHQLEGFLELASRLDAALSSGSMGIELRDMLTPFVLLGIVVASWALRPPSRKLSGSTG